MTSQPRTEPAFTLTLTRGGREFEVQVSEPWKRAGERPSDTSGPKFEYEIVVESAEAECELLQSFGAPVEKREHDGVVGWELVDEDDD